MTTSLSAITYETPPVLTPAKIVTFELPLVRPFSDYLLSNHLATSSLFITLIPRNTSYHQKYFSPHSDYQLLHNTIYPSQA